MKIRKIFSVLLLCAWVAVARGASQDQEVPNGLELVKSEVYSEQQDPNHQKLVMTILLKNVSQSEVTVLTQNLQDSAWLYKDQPKEIHLDLASLPIKNNSVVIPPLSHYSPVNLKPGETIQIKHDYLDRNGLKEVVLEYDMLNQVTERYKTWRGRLRSKTLSIKKKANE